MQRFSNVSSKKFEFEVAWAALAQASRLAGSGCMNDQTLSSASIRSRSESWCPEGLREALASESDDLDRQKRWF